MNSVVEHLAPHGVASFWSAAPSEHFEERLKRHFDVIDEVEIAHDTGYPDVIYLASQPII